MLALLAAVALASEDPPVSEEVIVRPEPKEAREQVVLALSEMGYQPRRTKDGRDVFVSATPWKPRVYIDRDGWMYMRRRPCLLTDASGRAAGSGGSFVDHAVCLLNPLACVHCRGQIALTKIVDAEKDRVAAAVRDELEVYAESIADEALEHKLAWTLPAELSAIWEDDGRTWPERRSALLEIWRNRTCTEWGDRARHVVSVWLAVHVQRSDEPFTDDELAGVEACGAPIRLPEL